MNAPTRPAAIALCLASLLAASCVSFHRGRVPPPTREGGETSTRGSGARIEDVLPTRKVVQGKEEPTTLIAADGSRCTTTPSRFREIAIGELAWCIWRDPSGGASR